MTSLPRFATLGLSWLVRIAAGVLLTVSPLAQAANADAEKPAAEATAPITDEECAAFGTELAEAFAQQRMDVIVQAFDPFAASARILAGLDVNAEFRAGFQSGFVKAAKDSVRQQLASFNGGKFLRVQTVGGEKHALLRCLAASGGVNYLSFVCARRASGRLKWVDFYSYGVADSLSGISRKMVLPAAAAQQQSILQRLTSAEGEYVRNFAQVQKAAEAIRAGRNADAARLLAALPAALRREKPILILRLRAAQEDDPAEAARVIAEWGAAYPNDPALDLLAIDVDIERKDFNRAAERVDSLDRQIGGDPYLGLMKANILRMAGRFDECRAVARATLKADRTLTSAYDVLLQIELDHRRHAVVAELLAELEREYPGTDMDAAIANEAAYAEFRQSSAYRDWVKRRALRP